MIILVGSENAGTGKTTLVTNLAVLFSTHSEKNNVVIVDTTQNDVAAKWAEARKEISSEVKTKVSGSDSSIRCVAKYNDLSKKLNQLNEEYDRVIVDCGSCVSLERDIFSEFEIAASVAHMVIFPFRQLKDDFDTPLLIVEHIKKAKETNPKLVACAVITMYSDDADLNETEIDEIFAEYVDTVTLIKHFIYAREVYPKALNSGYSVIELEDEDANEEIRKLNSALVKIYKNRNKIRLAPTEASETNEEGSTQEQRLEIVPSTNGNSVPILNQPIKIIDKTTKELSEESIDELARQYLDKHNEIEKLITDVNEALDFSDDSFLTLGDQLAIIFGDIKANNKKSAKKVFVAIKKQTAEKVNAFDVNTINKVVKVACNKVISQYRKESKLPNRWGTLYLLTSLNDEEIHELIATNNITVDTTRKELKQIADGIKGKKSKPATIKRLTIKRADGKEVTEKERDKLVPFLQKNGWVLHEPKLEISTETKVK